mmetsp:Transcript_23743/g.59584  ORF Transcript_23743/g.59584 Transcript_23743/m.59584 type:complete len:213 (+) Transcript_23743:181-819(+)
MLALLSGLPSRAIQHTQALDPAWNGPGLCVVCCMAAACEGLPSSTPPKGPMGFEQSHGNPTLALMAPWAIALTRLNRSGWAGAAPFPETCPVPHLPLGSRGCETPTPPGALLSLGSRGHATPTPPWALPSPTLSPWPHLLGGLEAQHGTEGIPLVRRRQPHAARDHCSASSIHQSGCLLALSVPGREGMSAMLATVGTYSNQTSARREATRR